eukprot:gene24125-30435_t
MATKYEIQHNIKFDWVVLVRLDAAWVEPVMPIETFSTDRVWATETGFEVRKVMLTRLIMEDFTCQFECERLQLHVKEIFANGINKAYKYMSRRSSYDTRSSSGGANSKRSGSGVVDYSQSLYTQRDVLHSSVLMNLKDLEMWRLHPTWNTEGCLAYDFTAHNLTWRDCTDHFKFQGGNRGNSEQGFFLQVIPHVENTSPKIMTALDRKIERSYQLQMQQSVPLTAVDGIKIDKTGVQRVSTPQVNRNVTRVAMVNRLPKVLWSSGPIRCLTIMGPIALDAPVSMADCINTPPYYTEYHTSQAFQTVIGLTRGSHAHTSVDRLHVLNAPELCVARDGTAEKGHANYLISDFLTLLPCYKEGHQHRILFEFELLVDSQIRDLLSDDAMFDAQGRKVVKTFKLRERQNKSVFLEGLTSFQFTTSEQALQVLSSALRKRCSLISYALSDVNLVNISSLMHLQQMTSDTPHTVIGAAGNVFIQVKVEQAFRMKDKNVVVHRESQLEIISLATSETLNSKPSPNEVMMCLPEPEVRNFWSIYQAGGKHTTSIAVNGNLKALSTLTRVVQIMRVNTAAGPSVKWKHVPFRDSMLTRMLKQSLHGNCYLTVMTVVNGDDIDGTLQALKFAGGLNGFFNKIAVNERLSQFEDEPVAPLYKAKSSMACQTDIDLESSLDSIPPSDRDSDLMAGTDNDEDDDDDEDGDKFDEQNVLDVTQITSSQQRANNFAAMLGLLQKDISTLSGDLNRLNAAVSAPSTCPVDVSKLYADMSRSRAGSGAELFDFVSASGGGLSSPNRNNSTPGPSFAPDSPVIAQRSTFANNSPTGGQHKHSFARLGSATKRTDGNNATSSPIRARLSSATSRAKTPERGLGRAKTPERGVNRPKTPQTVVSRDKTPDRESIRAKTPERGFNRAKTPDRESSRNKILNREMIRAKTPERGARIVQQASTASSIARSVSATRLKSVIEGVILRDRNQPVLQSLTRPGVVNAADSNQSPKILATTKSTSKLLHGSAHNLSRRTLARLENRPHTASPLKPTIKRHTIASNTTNNSPSRVRSSRGRAKLQNATVLRPSTPTSRPSSSSVGKTLLPALDSPPSCPVEVQSQLATVELGADVRSIGASQIPLRRSPFLALDDTREAESSVFTFNRRPSLGSLAKLRDDDVPTERTSLTSLTSFKHKKVLSFSDQQPTHRVHSQSMDLPDTEPLPSLDKTDSVELQRPRAQSETDTAATIKSTVSATTTSFLIRSNTADNKTELEALFLHVSGRCNVELSEECLMDGVNVHVRNHFGRNALQLSARNGSLPMLTLLTQYGGNLHTKGPDNDTLFHLAASFGHVETLKWL